MNFFGKNLDEATVTKLNQILNSPEGQKLKKELSQLDTSELADKLKGLDLSDIDIKDVAEKIDRTSKDEIINQLNNINSKFFKKGR